MFPYLENTHTIDNVFSFIFQTSYPQLVKVSIRRNFAAISRQRTFIRL